MVTWNPHAAAETVANKCPARRSPQESGLDHKQHYPSVLAEVKQRAMRARILPVLSVPVARAVGEKPRFTVDVFDGEDVASKARAVAQANRLPEKDVEEIVGKLSSRSGLVVASVPNAPLPSAARSPSSAACDRPLAAARDGDQLYNRWEPDGARPVLQGREHRHGESMFDPALTVAGALQPPSLLPRPQVIEKFSSRHNVSTETSGRLMKLAEAYARQQGLIPVMVIRRVEPA